MAHRSNINGPLAWSLLSIVATVLIVALMLPTLLRAAFADESGVEDIGEEFNKLMVAHTDTMAVYQDRFDGRSVFFKPRPPRRDTPPLPRPRVVERKEEPKIEAPPPEPKRPPYNGPSVIAALGGTVFFSDDVSRALGDGEKDRVEVLAVDLPWTVKVKFREWEYDLPLFERKFHQYLLTDEPAPLGSLPGFIEVSDAPAEEQAAASSEAEGATPASVEAAAADGIDGEDTPASTDDRDGDGVEDETPDRAGRPAAAPKPGPRRKTAAPGGGRRTASGRE